MARNVNRNPLRRIVKHLGGSDMQHGYFQRYGYELECGHIMTSEARYAQRHGLRERMRCEDCGLNQQWLKEAAPKKTAAPKAPRVTLYRWSGGPGGSTDVSWGTSEAEALERARLQHGCESKQELAREYPDAVVESVTVRPTAHAIAQLLEDVENYVCAPTSAASALTGLIID